MPHASVEPSSTVSTNHPDGTFRTLRDIEADVIRVAVKRYSYYKGGMARVAKELGIGRSTLYRKLDAYDI